MTTHEYIKERFEAMEVYLTESELLDIYPDCEEMYNVDIRTLQLAVLNFIHYLLLKPNVSEGGVSVSWNANDLKDFYKLECMRLGVENKLDPKPKITFL